MTSDVLMYKEDVVRQYSGGLPHSCGVICLSLSMCLHRLENELVVSKDHSLANEAKLFEAWSNNISRRKLQYYGLFFRIIFGFAFVLIFV